METFICQLFWALEILPLRPQSPEEGARGGLGLWLSSWMHPGQVPCVLASPFLLQRRNVPLKTDYKADSDTRVGSRCLSSNKLLGPI